LIEDFHHQDTKTVRKERDFKEVTERESISFRHLFRFALRGSAAPGRVVYVYKSKEQPRETIAYAPDGPVRERVLIEYDSRGNRIRKTHTLPSGEGRPL
jgi:hypothetical protein